MAYTKTNWSNDTAPAINEDNLNKIEDGIFEAHTENEELNNKINLITKYSDQEIIVGEWLGKPLYRNIIIKQIELESTTTTVKEKKISHGINNLEFCVFKEMFDENGNKFPFLSRAGGVTSLNNVNETEMTIRWFNDSWGSRNFYFVLEYTKTTD